MKEDDSLEEKIGKVALPISVVIGGCSSGYIFGATIEDIFNLKDNFSLYAAAGGILLGGFLYKKMFSEFYK